MPAEGDPQEGIVWGYTEMDAALIGWQSHFPGNPVLTLESYSFFFFLIFIVIQLQLYGFSPHPSTPPQLNPPPSPTSTLPPGFVHVSFIVEGGGTVGRGDYRNYYGELFLLHES